MALGTQLWMSLFGQGLGQRDTEVPGSLSHSVIPCRDVVSGRGGDGLTVALDHLGGLFQSR